MPWLSLKVNKTQLVAKAFERLRLQIPLIGRKRIYDVAVEIRKRMKVEPERPTYPINWDSTKQRTAFFASDGFGGGIPHKRTHEYTKAWQVIKTDYGYDVGNPLSHAQFIGGTARGTGMISNIHKGRWPVFKRQIEIVLRPLPKSVKENLKTIARNLGFKVQDGT